MADLKLDIRLDPIGFFVSTDGGCPPADDLGGFLTPLSIGRALLREEDLPFDGLTKT